MSGGCARAGGGHLFLFPLPFFRRSVHGREKRRFGGDVRPVLDITRMCLGKDRTRVVRLLGFVLLGERISQVAGSALLSATAWSCVRNNMATVVSQSDALFPPPDRVIHPSITFSYLPVELRCKQLICTMF